MLQSLLRRIGAKAKSNYRRIPPDNQHAERDIYNIGTVVGDVNVYSPASSVRPRNKQILLTQVKSEIEARREGSLHNAIFLNLGKETQPEKVKRPWDEEIKIGTKAATAIPDDTTIAEVFDSPAIGGKLLILGQPGAGKTTTLLDLAKALVKKAEDDADYPVPLLFNLSSWKDEKQPIREWMVAELRSKYGVSTKLGQQWVRDQVLLPLLDGLDEVAPERQGPCIQAINDFLSDEAPPLYVVVCSRIAEYENHQIPLELNGAVYLNELKDNQIQDYLLKVGRQELWDSIASNSELLAFVRTPLLLRMTVIAYSPGMVEQWQQLPTAEKQLQYLLDAYVERMLHRRIKSRSYGKRKLPNSRQTRYWLRWLAIQMDQTLQTEFLIEEMQPFMLPVSRRKIYQMVVRLIVGLLVGLIYSLVGGLTGGLIVGFGLFWGLSFKRSSKIEPVETLEFSWEKLKFNLTNKLIARVIDGLIVGLLFGLFRGLFWGLIEGLTTGLSWRLIAGLFWGLIEELTTGLSWGLIAGLFLGLIEGLIYGLFEGLDNSPLDIKTLPNQGISRSASNCVIFGLFFGLLGGLPFGLFIGLLSGLTYGLKMGLTFGLLGGLVGGSIRGGEACIQHLTLRILLYQSKLIPWNYAQFLDYCTERLLIQRVGGRYRFVHKLLQDHFARMPQNSL